MNRFQKFLALGAVVAASSSLAFADQITVDGFGTYTSTTLTFGSLGLTDGPSGDTGVFAPVASGLVSFNTAPLDFAAASSFPATEIFTVANNGVTDTFFATGDAPASPTGSFTPPNATNPGLLDLALTGYGYFTFSDNPGVEIPATFTVTSQDGLTADGTIVADEGISGTGMSVTPEPNSLILMGTGLIGAAGLLFMRRRQANATL